MVVQILEYSRLLVIAEMVYVWKGTSSLIGRLIVTAEVQPAPLSLLFFILSKLSMLSNLSSSEFTHKNKKWFQGSFFLSSKLQKVM